MSLPHSDQGLFLEDEGRRARILQALSMLRDAWDGARDLQVHPEEFALEMRPFYVAGLTNTDLRWLVAKGYVEHLEEQIDAHTGCRSFRRSLRLTITPSSCFVLSVTGLVFALEWANWPAPALSPVSEPVPPAACTPLPHWDGELRVLRWKDFLVKRYRVPAVNQERILTALEEEGWPSRIDDPLPPTRHIDPKARLHDAIKGLNRHCIHPLLCFHGDGTGRGLSWGLTLCARTGLWPRGEPRDLPRPLPDRK
jgi:hypothetical protein